MSSRRALAQIFAKHTPRLGALLIECESCAVSFDGWALFADHLARLAADRGGDST